MISFNTSALSYLVLGILSFILFFVSTSFWRYAKTELLERNRLNLISQYHLSDTQIRYKVRMGEEFYIENPIKGIYAKAVSKFDIVCIKSLTSGKDSSYISNSFADELILLSNQPLESKGVKVYSIDAYKAMLNGGYKLEG